PLDVPMKTCLGFTGLMATARTSPDTGLPWAGMPSTCPWVVFCGPTDCQVGAPASDTTDPEKLDESMLAAERLALWIFEIATLAVAVVYLASVSVTAPLAAPTSVFVPLASPLMVSLSPVICPRV